MHTSISAFSRVYLGYQSVMHQGSVRDCDINGENMSTIREGL